MSNGIMAGTATNKSRKKAKLLLLCCRQYCKMAYRARVSSSTNQTPVNCYGGRVIEWPADVYCSVNSFSWDAPDCVCNRLSCHSHYGSNYCTMSYLGNPLLSVGFCTPCAPLLPHLKVLNTESIELDNQFILLCWQRCRTQANRHSINHFSTTHTLRQSCNR